MCFVGEQKHEVMHLVDRLTIFHLLSAPLWKYLLTQKVNEIFKIWIFCKLHILFWMLKAHLNAVVNWSAH